MAVLITGLAQGLAQGLHGWKPKKDNKDSVRSSTEEAQSLRKETRRETKLSA